VSNEPTATRKGSAGTPNSNPYGSVCPAAKPEKPAEPQAGQPEKSAQSYQGSATLGNSSQISYKTGWTILRLDEYDMPPPRCRNCTLLPCCRCVHAFGCISPQCSLVSCGVNKLQSRFISCTSSCMQYTPAHKDKEFLSLPVAIQSTKA
jgi:hypothetical protein